MCMRNMHVQIDTERQSHRQRHIHRETETKRG